MPATDPSRGRPSSSGPSFDARVYAEYEDRNSRPIVALATVLFGQDADPDTGRALTMARVQAAAGTAPRRKPDSVGRGYKMSR